MAYIYSQKAGAWFNDTPTLRTQYPDAVPVSGFGVMPGASVQPTTTTQPTTQSTTQPPTTTPTPTQYAGGLPPDDPSNKYNTATGQLNPNYNPSMPAPATSVQPTTPTTGAYINQQTQQSVPIGTASPGYTAQGQPIKSSPQLNVETSIVDYLKSIGKPSDFASRTALAQQYGITNYSGTAEQNTQLLNTLRSRQQPTPIQEISPIPSTKDLGLTTTTPTIPDITADTIAYTQGLATQVQQSRTQLENIYQKQIDDLQTKQATSQAKIDELTSKEQTLLTGDIQTLLQPYREALEKSERERLKIEENYFANQDAIAELNDLLTQGQADIEAAQAVTGLSSIRTPRIAKIKEDIAARAGIIQAVMAARNNQIGIATNLIDRTANAIASDRNNQLKYYESLFNFYKTQRTEEGTKLLNLTNEEQDYINAQINLIQNDLTNAQATYNYVKQMMLDPKTADMLQRANINLNDTILQIQQKLSNYTYSQEVIDKNNKMESDGYDFITEAQAMTKPANEVAVMTDSRGKKQYWWKATKAAEAGNLFKTPDGETVDITTVEGIKSLVAEGYTNYADLYAFLEQNIKPKLTASAIKSLLSQAGIQETQTLTDAQLPVVIESIKNKISSGDATRAQIDKILDTGRITSNKITYSLTASQVEQIKNAIKPWYSKLWGWITGK